MKYKAERTRRNGIDITAEVLRISKGGVKKTHIMNKANINFLQLNRYVGRLMKKGLLELRNPDRLYKTTCKGLKFIEEYQAIQSLMT